VPAQAPGSGRLSAPRVVATGVPVPLRGSGVAPGSRLTIEQARRGGWRRAARARADRRGRYRVRVTPKGRGRRYRFRAVVAGAAPTRAVRLRTRGVTLDAVGDVNLGDGVAAVMGQRGARYPWSGVARELRSADVAFGNLECAVSTRGQAIPKEFNFRGRPGALRVARRYAGMDVFNLANNHTGDFGTTALLDTVRLVRRAGIKGIGAGRNLAAASRPRVVRRLGLRIAFVGYSDINPAGFPAGPHRPGTSPATPSAVAKGVRRASRRADVVVASFHWGVERATRPNARQRGLAGVALRAGADAVVGAHPHVLQPVERRGRRVVAYSLGNFVWSAGSGLTARTGILRLRLTGRGVAGARLIPARIAGARPAIVR